MRWLVQVQLPNWGVEAVLDPVEQLAVDLTKSVVNVIGVEEPERRFWTQPQQLHAIRVVLSAYENAVGFELWQWAGASVAPPGSRALFPAAQWHVWHHGDGRASRFELPVAQREPVVTVERYGYFYVWGEKYWLQGRSDTDELLVHHYPHPLRAISQEYCVITNKTGERHEIKMLGENTILEHRRSFLIRAASDCYQIWLRYGWPGGSARRAQPPLSGDDEISGR